MSASSSPDNLINNPVSSSVPVEQNSGKPLPYVAQEDIIYRAFDRKTVCRVLSQAHIYVSIRWTRTHLYIGIPSTVLAAVAGVQAISGTYQLVAVIIPVLVAILAPLLTFLDPNGKANTHLVASRVYEQMADQYDSFLLKCRLEPRPIEEELNDLVQINSAYGESKKSLPACPEWAYQKALRTENDIQKLIPDELKKAGNYGRSIGNTSS
ncbi:SLATT domain-containing protein [Planktothrix sp. FACHB-1365]|uniref:SLATT domain-containing protein n=1 Tax=Planktothrix sp. FACHB-1365 TaxID=2692855 RepID=UPI0016860531|nr:SLATT domain-containing protein [Planktothrix sp. FACHB-1365]MBD2483690.1 SLATT domain-containing protein [Planktothrix sp. FACHB-1365]